MTLAPDGKRIGPLDTELPFILGGESYLFDREMKQSTHEVFRRLYMKRRMVNGEYEDDWQEIPERRVMSYGAIESKIDEKKINYFDQSGQTVKVDNTDGYFAGMYYAGSFWSGYHSQYRTLCKMTAGYYDSYTNMEFPSETTLFYGILTDDPKTTADKTASFTFRSMLSVFDEIKADEVASITTASTLTADRILEAVKQYSDSNGVKILQKYFSTGAWNITTNTSYSFPSLNTTTALSGMTVLTLIKKLAEPHGYAIWVDSSGDFNFGPRSAGATSIYHFYGGARYLQNQAHTIISIDSYDLKVTGKTYNWIRVKYLEPDTSTSYREAKETWTWGDSSSAFYYGVRKLEIENLWLTTAGADTVASGLLTEFGYPKYEINFKAKFFPGLHLLDRITVSNQIGPDAGAIWGVFSWGTGIWSATGNQADEFTNKDFYVLAVKHDADRFVTQITAREI